MQDDGAAASGRTFRIIVVTALVLLGVLAGWGAARMSSFSAASLSSSERQAIETVVREYMLEHPEIIPEAINALQQRDDAKQLAGISDAVHAPFPGAVLGNPAGRVTLVEFSDFACGYCRKSVDDIETLISRNPDLRIVVRELPILSPHSVEAARMALAAAEQGKYVQFHRAMFAAGQPGPETIESAARQAGLDLDKALATAKSERVEQELGRNLAFARQLGFDGTPSWIAGDQLISGAVGADELAKAVEDIRGG